jgi:hypothetical protein
MLLYQKEAIKSINERLETQNELWVYDVQTKKHGDGYNTK